MNSGNTISLSTKQKDIEYEDAYVIEEKALKYEEIEDDKLITDTYDNLSLDSLGLSEDDDLNDITADYDKIKLASEISKRKIDHLNDKKTKTSDFRPKIVKREEVVEDFIRNFFTKYTLAKTLDEFNVKLFF